jgi:hypothetical protein
MEFYVEAREECAECKGVGIVQDYRWDRYWEENPKGWADSNEKSHPRLWFYETYGATKLPPEEHSCTRCNGSGVIVTKVRLEDALSRIEAMRL